MRRALPRRATEDGGGHPWGIRPEKQEGPPWWKERNGARGGATAPEMQRFWGEGALGGGRSFRNEKSQVPVSRRTGPVDRRRHRVGHDGPHPHDHAGAGTGGGDLADQDPAVRDSDRLSGLPSLPHVPALPEPYPEAPVGPGGICATVRRSGRRN